MSINELAQILTQALDENFNIKNQSAVVKVVTCLEAFNITHESYREVQSTRIIKDLQALRQNKANDQVLAKRIKNLLRKWKDRLSTIPSQPNSPQNISQGSSDTQFMTQKSQSPPNSQPARLVNGPTSFKNLLPKSQNYAVTSPVVPHHNNHQAHPQQNGIVDPVVQKQQQSAGKVLLGKRKMPPSNNSTRDGSNTGDIDENSNHNKKSKMMKKSESPLKLNANNNSNSNSIIHHNNNLQQISNNKLLLHSNVPVTLQQQPHQSQQKTNNNSNNISTQQKVDEPKKRGRRKGSRGFDATLNGNIPDFQAEIQQKIALSAGKRNKTTVELQQMLESHTQNTCASWTNGDVHDSNSSLDRVNFSSSSYHPVEPIYSNFDQKIKKEVSDSAAVAAPAKPIEIENHNQFIPTSSIKSDVEIQPKTELASSSLRSLDNNIIEDEIAKLYAKLPPIDYEEAERAQFEELNSFDVDGNLVVCTCTFREVITYEDDETKKAAAMMVGFGDENSLNNSNKNSNNKVNINGDNKISNSMIKQPADDDDDDDDETDDFCAVEDIVEKSPTIHRSAVKSIFDPEYDANENLIEEMMNVRRKPTAAAAATQRDNLPKVIEVKIEKDAVKSSRIESMMSATMIPEEQQPVERVPIINYECVEDPECQAREHFRMEQVTPSNVHRLHNSFVNGINGFWNGVLEEQAEHDYSKDGEDIDYAKHQLWKRVVPRYNFLTLDKIPKKFNVNSSFSIPPAPSVDEKLKDEKKTTFDDVVKTEGDLELDDSLNKFSMNKHRDIEFREWHEVMNVRSYNDEILTILPYVVID